jgi:hypothetical protein
MTSYRLIAAQSGCESLRRQRLPDGRLVRRIDAVGAWVRLLVKWMQWWPGKPLSRAFPPWGMPFIDAAYRTPSIETQTGRRSHDQPPP